MTKSNYHLYFGKAGHLFVMAEFLLRGWNVAIPEVDEGDDIFVVKHEDGKLIRVQVKTANAKMLSDGFLATFSIGIQQLTDISKEDIVYVFLVRKNNDWISPLIITREDLLDTMITSGLNKDSKNQTIRFVFRDNKVLIKKIDLTEYQNNFEDFIIEI
jgi:hypothetical protein